MLTTLDHLVLTVADIDATTRFYSGALGMEAISFTASGGGTRHALRYGSQKINLHPAGTAYEPRARVPTPGSADLCFLTDMPLEAWQSRLAGHGIEIIEGPVPRSGATGPLMSIYIRDPDGNLVEISLPD